MSVVGIEAKVTDALFRKVGALTFGNPVLPYNFQEAAFDPPADGRYIYVSISFNNHAFDSLDGSQPIRMGIMQATVRFPKDVGIVKPTEVASEIVAAFKNLVLFDSGLKIKVSATPYLTGPFSDNVRVSVPVNIPWTVSVV